MGRDTIRLAKGMILTQDDTLFKLTQDTVLLSDFARLAQHDLVCDLGCGNGALSLLLRSKMDVRIDGIEIEPKAAMLAEENVQANGLEKSIFITCADLTKLENILSANAYDHVVCNPPYYPEGQGKQSASAEPRNARHETCATLEDICKATKRLLRSKGKFSMVHKPERLSAIFKTMQQYNLMPKRMRFVQQTATEAPNTVLIEACLDGKEGLCLLPPLLLQDNNGNPTLEYRCIYGKEEV